MIYASTRDLVMFVGLLDSDDCYVINCTMTIDARFIQDIRNSLMAESLNTRNT